jgi:transposase InsO family protein
MALARRRPPQGLLHHSDRGSQYASGAELVHDATWDTRAAARTELFEYLERFYNGQRRHSALGYLSPRAFEQRREQEALAP